MKRSLTLFIVVVLAALVPSTAAAYLLSTELLAFIAAVPASNDFAVGEGKFSKTARGEAEQFNFAAHGPVNAKGHLRVNSATLGEGRGRVTCLFVSGNSAGVAGTFDEPLGGQFTHFALGVVDNGEPSDAPPEDRAAILLSTSSLGGADCSLADALSFGSLPIEQGNIVVKDRGL